MHEKFSTQTREPVAGGSQKAIARSGWYVPWFTNGFYLIHSLQLSGSRNCLLGAYGMEGWNGLQESHQYGTHS